MSAFGNADGFPPDTDCNGKPLPLWFLDENAFNGSQHALSLPVKAVGLFVAGCIYTVWLYRATMKTPYRAGNAQDMYDEFEVFGLGRQNLFVIGAAKLTLATMLAGGCVVSSFSYLVFWASFLLWFIQFVAALYHYSLRDDPLDRALPAASLALLLAYVVFSSQPPYCTNEIVGYFMIMCIACLGGAAHFYRIKEEDECKEGYKSLPA